MQTSYSEKPAAGVAGLVANTMPSEIEPASFQGTKTFEVSVATVSNSAAYTFTLSYPSRATPGTTATSEVTYTSDGSATKAEILEGLRAAVAALAASVQISAALTDSANGPLLVYADVAALDFDITGPTANLSVAEADGEIPFGVFVVADGAADKCRLPVLAADIGANTLGVSVRTLSQENLESGDNAYAPGSQVNVLKKGDIWMEVEETVAFGDPVYVRYAANGDDTQKGAVRKSGDGVAQVTTLTPTAANAALYEVGIGAYSYAYESDGSGTAAEVVTDLKAQINAQTALHGVTATGTATLILTGIEGIAFDVSQSANLSAAATTAVTATAKLLEGCSFRSAASAGELALVRVNL
jgi:hypothetical protein